MFAKLLVGLSDLVAPLVLIYTDVGAEQIYLGFYQKLKTVFFFSIALQEEKSYA